MSAEKVFLAIDLGAESGRVVAGCFDGERLREEEIHRFGNGPVKVGGHLHWNALLLFSEIKTGIAKAVERHGSALASAGVDTWGVDYGLLDREGRLLGHPFNYRDERTDRMDEEAFKRASREAIYEATGIQFMFFNTLFQILSEVVEESAALSVARRLLFMPDLLNYWLTGRQANERTIASTSQLLDPRTGDWARALMDTLGIPRDIFGDIVPPGTVLGDLLPEIADETGARGLAVVAPGCHDTASAVAAVPVQAADYAYLSSGTWSLMGIENPQPVISAESLACGFTNEGGVCGTIRMLKNICGLWLVQECRRTWASGGEEPTYAGLAELAEQAPPFQALIDPDDPGFAAPGDMPARIEAFCRRTGQEPPADRGAMIRCILESLALAYRRVYGNLEKLSGRRLDVLHIVGGGTRNRLLNRFAAGAVNRTVITGPAEATAAGNVLMQMLARGDIDSLEQGRQVIRQSFQTETYEPADPERWDEAAARYEEMMGRS